MIFRTILFALLAIAPAAFAQPHITDTWPDRAQVSGVREEHVTFPSSSPFGPADIGRPGTPPATDQAVLYLPPDARPDGKTPAVVMLHGAAGNIAERGATYGPQLAAMGVAVLVIDTFGSRPDMGGSFNQRLLNITETMFVADAYAGLRYLAARPEIDRNHVVLTGFSYGGMSTMYALYAQMADRFVPPDLRFAAHVSFYGPCIARFEDSRTTGAPLLMLYGADDELIRPARCDQIADDLRRGGSTVQVISYPGAVHQWDGGLPRMMIGHNLAGCSFRVDREGRIYDPGTGILMEGPLTRRALLLLCVKSDPYPIGRDDTVRAESNRDFGRFLAAVFRQPNAALQRVGASSPSPPGKGNG
jgi:dienelactone hydrolase